MEKSQNVWTKSAFRRKKYIEIKGLTSRSWGIFLFSFGCLVFYFTQLWVAKLRLFACFLRFDVWIFGIDFNIWKILHVDNFLRFNIFYWDTCEFFIYGKNGFDSEG